MNLAAKNTVETSDYSYLNADELRAALLQKEADLEAKDAIIAHTHDLLTQAIADRDKYKTITDELLRLAKVQRFAASSEKVLIKSICLMKLSWMPPLTICVSRCQMPIARTSRTNQSLLLRLVNVALRLLSNVFAVSFALAKRKKPVPARPSLAKSKKSWNTFQLS